MNEHQIKAREIVIKMQFQPNPLAFEQARICALILIDEVFRVLPNINRKNQIKELDARCYEYWLKVKQEIQNL